MIILTLNPGSSSLKYAVFESNGGSLKELTSGQAPKLDSKNTEESISTATKDIISKLSNESYLKGKVINSVCCRVVHGGPEFSKPTLVTKEVLEKIRSLVTLAPLHNPLSVSIIESCIQELADAKITAFFDTAFHQTIPQVASTYALPRELVFKFGLKRYGFHGIAHQYVSESIIKYLNLEAKPSKIITCHLGNGASICAVKDGKSIDTSMGFTPLEGLIMGTRGGDIDPGILLHLMKNCGIESSKIDELLNHKSGLLGISGLSSDSRDLEKAALEGDKYSELALECFSYRVSKYIGAYIAALNGVDAIAFSGGIGENSSKMRERICKRLKCFAIELSESKNLSISSAHDICISPAENKVQVWVIHSNEELFMAKKMVLNER